MKQGDKLGLGQVVRINAGKWDGLVGEVVAIDEEAGRADVYVAGVVNDEPVEFTQSFAFVSLGRNDET